MFISAYLPTIPYQDPSDVSLEDRLSLLRTGDRKVVYYYENPDNSIFRYRVFNMVESLNASPGLGISASWFAQADSERMERFIDQADTLVLCRVRYAPVVDRLLRRAKLRKIPVLFDVDDLVFESGYLSLIMDSLDQDSESERDWNIWFAYTGRLAATLRRCDGVITTNQYLADEIAAFAPGMVPRIVPNFLNRAQQERSCAIWESKRSSNLERDDQIHIGYFSGTPTHNRDFEVAASALAKIMDEDSRVVPRVVGFRKHGRTVDSASRPH